MAFVRKAGRPYTLYRIYGDNDLLLYVGITWTPHLRIRGHESTRWWHLARTVKVEHFDEMSDAERAEERAIQVEWPLLNTRGNRCAVLGCGGVARAVLLCQYHYAQAPASTRFSQGWLRQIMDSRSR